MELFGIIGSFLRRITGIILALTIIGSPLTGWINRHKDNPVLDQQTYIDFTADYVTELFYPVDDDGMLSEPTKAAARGFTRAIIVQLMLGEKENGKIMEIAANMSHGDYPHDTETTWKQNAFEKALSDLLGYGESILPEDATEMVRSMADGINDIHVYFEDTDYEGVYEFCASYLDDSGDDHSFDTGIYYDSSTGAIYGHDNTGLFGIGFDLDAKQYVLVTPVDSWQKKFGFNIAYDIAGELLYMDCKTVRIKFKAYGKDYMVQMWKGNYTTLTNGAEIGIYNKEESEPFRYDVVGESEYIPMSMTLTDNRNGDEILSVSSDNHWWLAAFKMAPRINKRYMDLDFTLEFKDVDFAEKFAEAAKENGIKNVTVNGGTVSGLWS